MDGCLHEILKLLGERLGQETLATTEMQALIVSLAPETKSLWDDMVEIANGANVGRRVVLSRIRNDVGFHYYNPKTLQAGFKAAFGTDEKNTFNTSPMACVGESMGKTRFFYADAAAQRSLGLIGERHDVDEPVEEVFRLAAEVNMVLGPLISRFLLSRGAFSKGGSTPVKSGRPRTTGGS